jgi:GTP-binding protein Era
VALAGWTNVGKSTLLNRLIGEKVAAVSPVAQTTRNRITGVLSLGDSGQIVFLDTPGFHRPKYRMNRAMVQVARETLGGVDVVVQVLDAARGFGAGDEQIAGLLARSGVKRVAALNKIDRVEPKTRLLPLMKSVVDDWAFLEALPVSALTGEGCREFLERVIRLLPEGTPAFPDDYLTDQPERVIAAEYVREKLLHHTRQEVPHAVAVKVEEWQEDPGGTVRVHAVILVEREGHKGIVIGKGGEMLKKVGTAARRDLERLLGTRVVLKLWVTVRRDWRNDRRTLRDLGLS